MGWLPGGILAVLAAAAVAPFLARRIGAVSGWVLGAVPAVLFGWYLTHAGEVADRGIGFTVPWVPSLEVEAAFFLDGLGLVFALLISGIGALILIYTGRYMDGHPQRGRLLALLLVFMAAMLGIVLADDVITLFVFWELTSIASYLLIGFDHEEETSRDSALQALLVTGGGGLALMVGLLLLGDAAGSYRLSEIVARAGEVQADPRYGAILGLILLGAFTKSAQWPFHFWLPNAMAAPTPVSAYLHSATMVKAGVYLLARLDPVLGGTGLWVWLVTPVGVVTMFLGALLALRETDLKRVLAYSTVMALGTLVALIGLSFPEAIKAAVVFLIVHSLYKASLFLVAGAVDHGAHTRSTLRLSGLRKTMPWTAAAAVLSGLSMAGLPPLFGFVAKELTYKAKLGVAGGELVLPAVAVAANALTVAAAAIVALRPFIGRLSSPARSSHEASPALLTGPLLLGALGLVFGLAPSLAGQWLVEPAVIGILGVGVEVDLALWHGFNMALLLSVVTVITGIVLYRGRAGIRAWLRATTAALPVAPEGVYLAGLDGVKRLAAGQTRVITRGAVPRHLTIIFAVTAGLLWLALWPALPAIEPPLPGARWLAWALAGIVVAEALGALTSVSRLSGAAALGALGFAVALLFLMSGAPDLATTQFLVETLIVLVLVVVLRRIRGRSFPLPQISSGRKVVAGLTALAVGSGFTALLMGVIARPLDATLPDFFTSAAVPEGRGRNIVNVILVDFRALDTMGEIAVLGIAALGIMVLLGRPVFAARGGDRGPLGAAPAGERHTGGEGRRGAAYRSEGYIDPLSDRPPAALPPSTPSEEVRPGDPGAVAAGYVPSAILRAATALMVPLLLLFSWYLLWRGHNEPGGGFIAGLVATGALALRVQAAGTASARRLLRLTPQAVIAVGLLLALASGLAGVVAGQPFMTGQWLEIVVPAGPVKLGTPLLFDVGVYFLVLGFAAAVLLTLEEPGG